MKFHLSRAVVATGLGASLWLASVSSFAAPQQSKDQGRPRIRLSRLNQPLHPAVKPNRLVTRRRLSQPSPRRVARCPPTMIPR